MRRTVPGPLVLIGIALTAAISGTIYTGPALRPAPMPPEVFERAKAILPAEFPSFEAREDSESSPADSPEPAVRRSRRETPEAQTPSISQNHNEADNDQPFEESLGQSAFGGGVVAGCRPRNLRSSSGEENNRMGSVDHALEWLRLRQRPDGSWDGDVQTTGLVLLAYLGGGQTHKAGRFKKTVRAGLKYLKRQQAADGWFTSRRDPAGQAIATLALCEAHLETKSPIFKASAQQGLACLELIGPARDPATWWMLLARHSAKLGKLRDEIPGSERAYTLPFPDDWSPVPGASRDAALGAEIVARVCAGQNPSGDREISFLADECLRTLPSWDDQTADPGALLFKTLALFQVCGDQWKQWNRELKSAVATSQVCLEDGTGYWDADSPRCRILGRTRTTALMTLTLEVYYRYARVVMVRQ